MRLPGLRRHFAVYVTSLLGGGAERVAALLASTLAKAGHHVTLLVDFDAPHNSDFVTANVERVTLGGGHAGNVVRLARFLKQVHPEIALAVGPACNVKLVLAHLMARGIARPRTKIILSYHGHSSFVSGWLGWSAYPLASLLARYAARTVCVSQGLLNHLVLHWRAPERKVACIYNPIPLERTKPVVDAAALAARPATIVAVGRLVADKDYPTLIAAFARLARPNVRLAIFGEGPERRALEVLAERLGVSGRIEWHGYVRDPWNAYAAARCFALTSRYESFGNVVIEALASGLPVVATECGGPDEILDGGRFGMLVPVGNIAAVSSALSEAIEQPGDPRPRIERAREFAAPAIAARYLELFEDVLAE